MKQSVFRRSILAALLAMLISAFAPFAHSATDPYLKIAAGDSRARVIKLLGNPVDPRTELTAADRKTIRSALRAIDKKDAADFAVWKQSGHLYYLIGFNKRDTVATKNRVLTIAGGR